MLLADAVTTVVQVVLLGGVAVFLIALFAWAFRGRARAARVTKSPLAHGATERPPGSAAEIEDAGQVPARELLGGLRVRDSDELWGLETDEVAHALGLKYFEGGGTRIFSGGATYPTLMYGERNGHEALIRWGLVGTSSSAGRGRVAIGS